MVEVGKIYAIGVRDIHGLLTHAYSPDTTINVRCSFLRDGAFHFEPVQYDGAVPEGRTQAMETFVVAATEIDKFAFVEQ